MKEAIFAGSSGSGRVERSPPGVEAVVLSKIKELSLDRPFELIKLIAWIQTLQDQTTRDRCKDLVRAEFVAPYAMSHDPYEYDRAMQLSDALSAPEDVLPLLREYSLRGFARQAGSDDATNEWDVQRLIQQLTLLVDKRRRAESASREVTVSDVFKKRTHSPTSDFDYSSPKTVYGEDDDLGGGVDPDARDIYRSFTGSDRFVA